MNAAEPLPAASEASRFPAAKFLGAIAMLVVGAVLMMVYIVLRGMSHSFGSREDDPWWWAGIVVQSVAGWQFLGVALDVSGGPPARRSWFVRPAMIVSYVLAAAILVFNTWAVAMILDSL